MADRRAALLLRPRRGGHPSPASALGPRPVTSRTPGRTPFRARSPASLASRARTRTRALALALALALGAASPSRAAEPAPPGDCVAVPFAQQVDVRTVAALAHEAPERLLARIDRLGIDLRRVPGGVPGRSVNPLLATLPAADPRLLGLAEFRDGYEGRSIPRAVLAGGPARDTVLIRETASTWTLLHEVVHLLIVPSDGFVPRADLELRFSLAFHRLQVYQRRLYDDPWRLLDPRWRRDIVDAQQEVATLLYDRLRIGQSQEAIIERVLEGCIDARSPYFDAARRDEGRRYGTAMIDNAIDVFDTLNASVEHTDATVRQLADDVAAGRLPQGPDRRLAAADREAFALAQRDVRMSLARTREEIDALKRYYGR